MEAHAGCAGKDNDPKLQVNSHRFLGAERNVQLPHRRVASDQNTYVNDKVLSFAHQFSEKITHCTDPLEG